MTVCIVGDGSLQHNIQELEIIKRHNLPIKIFILNNNGYASIRATQNKFFNGHHVGSSISSGVTLPNIKKISDVYGFEKLTIEHDSEIDIKTKIMLATTKPMICEVMIDEKVVTRPRVMNYVNDEGKLVSGTLDNMWPFL
jgi:acetolactate synthase-1/2/3 large subunit